MTTRISRREVLAFIALADAPMPERVDFDCYRSGGDALELYFGRVDQARAWLAVLGDVMGEPYEHERPADGDKLARRYFTAYNADGRLWRGWRMHISAVEDVASPDEPLDDATVAPLREIAEVAS